MKKIIWISSYPKSGNTWIRYFLSNYFFNKKKEESSFGILNKIDKFPPNKYLENIVDKKFLEKNPFNISKYWEKVQSEIVKSDNEYIFLKNHNALLTIEGNDFTNEIYSLGAIYLVRDPRDVVVSYSNFLRNLDINQTINRVTNKNLICHISKKNSLDIEILGSWKLNYISWRDGVKKIPKIIIRYEDLIYNTFETKLKIINFLSKLLYCKVDIDQLNFSISQSDFNRLKNIENIHGFHKNENNFFNSGKTKQWTQILSKEQIAIIENEFKEEMLELGYINL
tara:strand:+ start:20 stop:865 length:846 start_codon:yes stop_codon:yes gene_type:complete